MLGMNTALRRAGVSLRAFHTSPPAKLAKVTLIGRLGATPQVAKDKQGRDILIYSVATNEKVAPKEDGTRSEPVTTWHRVLSYNSGGREYLSTLPAGTLVHVEADFKKRVLKSEAGEYSEQTLMLLKSIDILAKPKSAADEPAAQS